MLAPVVTLSSNAIVTLASDVIPGGIVDQLVQALVSSGDVVVPPPPTAAVSVAAATLAATLDVLLWS